MDALRWVLLLIGIGVFLLIFLYSKKKDFKSGSCNDDAYSDDLIEADFSKVLPETNESLSLDELAQDMRLDVDDKAIDSAVVEKAQDTQSDSSAVKDEMMIVFYLVEKNNGKLSGSQIIDALKNVGLFYGDMKIFHYYDPDHLNEKKSIFSIANISEPGWFDLVSINQISTPGIAVFMSLPGSMKSVNAFDVMLSVIEELMQIMPVSLKDKKHDKVSQQTLSHLREEVVEFERKRSIALKV